MTYRSFHRNFYRFCIRFGANQSLSFSISAEIWIEPENQAFLTKTWFYVEIDHFCSIIVIFGKKSGILDEIFAFSAIFVNNDWSCFGLMWTKYNNHG